MAKKRLFQYLFLWFGMFTLLAGCERELANGDLYQEDKAFGPITSLSGESGYGYGLLRWQLPDSTQGLQMIQVSWTNSANVTETRKMTRFTDSLRLSLEKDLYSFSVTSVGPAGERHTDSLSLDVPDWKSEPVQALADVMHAVIGNGIYLTWSANTSRSYSHSTFLLYDRNGNFLQSVVRRQGESLSAEFENLGYNTPYMLKYYSENLSGMMTDTVGIDFQTDKKAPEMPAISVLDHAGEKDGLKQDIVTTVYAYSTEIQWTNSDPNIDSLRITFTGLNGEACDFRFAAVAGKGYLTLLPGGPVTLSVSARMTGEEEWSGAKAQSITTKLPTDTYSFRPKNGPDDKSKLGESLTKQTGKKLDYSVNRKYTYKELAETCNTVFEIHMKPLLIDEIELFPTIETLVVGKSSNPSSSTTPGVVQGPPTLSEFVKVIARLSKLRTVQVADDYHAGIRKSIVETFGDKSLYPHLTVTNFKGQELIVEGGVVKVKP